MDGGLAIGIDLGGTKIEVVAMDEAGRELVRRRRPTPRGDYGATLDAIAGLVDGAEREILGEGGMGRATVGVSHPGALSPATGLMRNSNSTWLNGRPFDKDLTARLGRPAAFANDANCLALSEATDGAGAGAGVVFAVILGTGVGGGVVVGGRVLSGANAIAGEWGHNPLPWPRDDERPGPPCYCGLAGCVETWLSGPGLAADHARVAGGGGLAAPDIVARAEAGDPAAAASLDRYEDRLARGLATIMNVLDPEVIVLAGGVSNVRRLYANVPRLWERYAFTDTVRTKLRPPVHGDSTGVRGAAWLGRALAREA
jgi:fructokinase